MKILISDDDDFKAGCIEEVVLVVYPKATIVRTKFAKAGILELIKNSDYDILIQDMFLPINENERIDNKGGIYVLEQMKYRDIDVKTCVCSSDSISYKYMVDKNFRNTPFIDFSSFQFRNDLIEFLKS